MHTISNSIVIFFIALLAYNSARAGTVPMVVPLDLPADSDAQPMTWGVGSDGYRNAKDAAGIFYTISDRGPNVDCEEDEAVFGRDICSSGKIFPTPSFQPSIMKWQWRDAKSPLLLGIIPLTNHAGKAVSGLSNPWRNATSENAYDVRGNKLEYDPEGVDPEGLVVLDDKSFWVSEEYGPSLMHVAADGEILERWVPKGMEDDLSAADYPVLGKLPAILKQRKLNRGIEALTLAPDGTHLLASMQSALENPSQDTAKSSSVVRLFSVDLRTKMIDGIFAYQFDEAKTFQKSADEKVKSKDLKISAITYLGKSLLVQERTDNVMKIFRFELGANLLNDSLTNQTKSPTLEEQGIDRCQKTLIWDGVKEKDAIPSKVEGMIAWSADKVLLVNDNDFGVTGEKSEAALLPIHLLK